MKIGLGEKRFPYSSCSITFPVHVKGIFINPVRGMVIQGAFVKSNNGDARGTICVQGPFRIVIPPNFGPITSQYLDVVCQEFKNELGKQHIIVIGSPWKMYDIPLKMRFIGFYTDKSSTPQWSVEPRFGSEGSPIFHNSLVLTQEIEEYHSSKKWERGGRYRMNPYELLDPQKAYHPRAILPENLGYTMTEPPISRAYYKIVEVIKIFNWTMLSPDDISVCLADAPGGMAQALTHIFPSNRVITTSLKETGEEIHYDPIILKNELITIDWLHSGDGDLTNYENVKTFSNRLPRKARLVSADGAFDHKKYETKREILHQQLLFAEIVTAISILATEGCFFVKLFGRSTYVTIKMLYWASLFFEEWYVYKPRSSRIGSTEVLVIYQKFRSPPEMTASFEAIKALQPKKVYELFVENLINIEVPTIIYDRFKEFNIFLEKTRKFCFEYSFKMEKHEYDPHRFIEEQGEFAKNFLKVA